MKLLSVLITLFCLAFTTHAKAEGTNAEPKHKNLGASLDFGVPSGVAIGLVARPNSPWMRFDVAATYSVAPGLRAGLTIDPIKYWISPSITTEIGHSFFGKYPGKSAEFELTYVNFHLGIEVGSQENFRFFIHGGPSYFVLDGNHLETLFNVNPDNIKLSNTTINGWFFPTGKIGAVLFF